MEDINLRNYAYLGDAVWELYIREKTILQTNNAKKLHQMTTNLVKTSKQYTLLHFLEPYLTEEENELVNARNDFFNRRIVRDFSRHLAETAGVPKLVAEVSAKLDALFAKQNVLSLRRAVHYAEAKPVGSVLCDNFERVGRIAEAL